MSIENVYKDLILDQLIQDTIKAGEVPDSLEIQEEFEALIATLDLTKPQFDQTQYYITPKEKASAGKFNNTFKNMRQDIRVLYKEMLELGNKSINSFERWHAEARVLEKRLLDLESHITDLLLLIQDTDGYFGFVQDNFTDTSLIDQSLTTTSVDIKNQIISLSKTGTSVTRLFLNNIDPINVTFKVRNSVDFLSRIDGTNTALVNLFHQTSDIWWTQIQMSTQKPVVCELLIKLSDTSVSLSRIDVDLHDSSQSSSMNITPLYSIDGFNFSQLPTNTYNQDIKSSGTFQFSPIEATFIKFILVKQGSDPSNQQNKFVYEFGFKQISFYSESFSANTTQQLITNVLFVIDSIGNPLEFSKLTLDTCERIEVDTNINYFITASNNPNVPVDDNIVWHQITPLKRIDPINPVVLDLGDIDLQTIGDDETLTISYFGRNTNSDFINPSNSFNLLSQGSSNVINEVVTTPILIRYSFVNSNDRILNYQIKDSNYIGSGSGNALVIDDIDIILFRNKGAKGFSDLDSTSKVRDIQKGWGFLDPYYSTVIQILNPNGISIDVGDKAIIIDEVSYTNKIDNKILFGVSGTQTGIHHISVHKDNWLSVEPNLTTLSALKAADNLYPFNHKLLVEGYQYDSSYPINSEKLYVGVDIFAEILMKQSSVFDLAHNIAQDNYNYYALDKDTSGTHNGGNLPTTVFLLKVNDQNPDFQNEEFVLKFKVINQKYKYLRLKAELSTEDQGITPALTAYKIKLG